MKRKLLVAVLCALAVFGCATFAAYAVGAPGNEGNAAGGGAPKSVYVRSDGNDVTGDGSQENRMHRLPRLSKPPMTVRPFMYWMTLLLRNALDFMTSL